MHTFLLLFYFILLLLLILSYLPFTLRILMARIPHTTVIVGAYLSAFV